MTARRWISAAVLVLATGLTLGRLVIGHSADTALARLHARGLPTTPGELDNWYRPVAPTDNLARTILNASGAYRPTRDLTNTPYTGKLEVPSHPVDPQSLSRWQAEIAQNTEVFDALARGRERTASRYPINLRAGPGTLVPHLGQVKRLVQFLALAALTDAESGHPAEAVRHVEDILVAARSLDAEPLLISQLVRASIVRIATGAAATSLPRTTVDDAGWKGLQEALVATATTTGIRNGLIGEISSAAGVFESAPAEMAVWFADDLGAGGKPTPGTRATAALYIASGVRALDERFCLDRLGEFLDASALPFPDALRRSRAVAQRVETEGTGFAVRFKYLSGILLNGLNHSLEQQAFCEASVRTTIAGCAIERHRLAHAGHPPETLAELVPAFLTAVPTDPFDGQPLRYHRTGDAFVVYSIGADGKDDGGEPQQAARKGSPARPTFDIVYRRVP